MGHGRGRLSPADDEDAYRTCPASPSLRSSGDIVVDRRFLYAQAAAAEGDHAAAAEILEQTLDLAPDWAPLWLALADMRARLGRSEDAAAACERAGMLDPSGTLGVAMHLARLGTRPAPKEAPRSYVRALFDDYAERFERHLTDTLSYCGPAVLQRALEWIGATSFSTAVDLGCGTGLCGEQFRSATSQLVGVDLSSRMVEAAQAKDIYDRLAVGSNEEFLRAEPACSASLVLAADVLVYTGDLMPIFASARRVLAPGGSFAFTLQRADSGSYCIGPDLRYAHAQDYVREAACEAGLQIRLLEPAATRLEAGEPIAGYVVVASATCFG